MTNYSLRARMMILILAPTVLIGLLLSIFFVAHRYNDLQRQLEDAGASIIEPLAVSSEYGMNLQNRESIGQLISVLHRRHSEIVRAISVYDSHNRLFVTSNYQLNPSELQIPKGEAFPRHLSVIRDGDMMILRTPIVSESYSPDESPESDAKMPGNMLGYVALELDLKSVRLQQYKEIFISSVMMLFCIGIALIFGWRLMRDVTGPIRNMVNTVDRIRRGQLDSRVEGFMLGELDMLKMALTRWPCRWRHTTKRCNTTSTRRPPIYGKRLSRWRSRTSSWTWRKSAPRRRRALSLSSRPICLTSCAPRSMG